MPDMRTMPTDGTMAREFAIRAHADQKYANGPYVAHLDAVVDVLKEFGHFDQALLDAAYLHDVLEDTDTDAGDLCNWFYAETIELVVAVTDQPGRNRAERHAATYPRIAANPKAVTLKLADRIANVRASIKMVGHGAMYGDEYPAFKAALQGEHHGAMWRELDRLLL